MMKKIALIAVLALIVLGAGVLQAASNKFRIVVPEYRKPGQIIQLEQGWTDSERDQFHHTPQGTRLVPYRWFLALEQPALSLTRRPRLANPTYLARFGFIASKPDPQLNPDGLPVGFARQSDFQDPETGKTYPVVGLNCAACHTGEMHWNKYTVQVEGAPAMIDVTQFQKALGLAMAFTKRIPFRYGRFEKNVLGPHPTDKQKSELKEQFDSFMEAAEKQKSEADEREIYSQPAGFGRTDALARIGNQVFGIDMLNTENLMPASAPVRFPQIWDASWFDWVQYNSSISDPLVRNIGEALGVRAVAKLHGPDAGEFKNSVDIRSLKKLEDWLSGPAPYKGLTSPKWPAVFPPLDLQQLERGAQLYTQRCQSCHRPPVKALQADLNSKKPRFWRVNNQGKPLYIVQDIKLDVIGTDPNEAMGFINRTADTGDLKQGRVSAAAGLDLVTKGIANRFFDESGFSEQQRIEWRGYSDPATPTVRAIAVYKARPLNGIWAAAPYLHNGSVPNLYQLLSPVSERSKIFWLGSKQFDPINVGYETTEIKGGDRYDVTEPGNSNKGHEFTNDRRGKGVIGPLLSPEDRRALVTYLKSL